MQKAQKKTFATRNVRSAKSVKGVKDALRKKGAKGIKALFLLVLSFQLAVFFPLATAAQASESSSSPSRAQTSASTTLASSTSSTSSIPAQLLTNPVVHSAALIDGVAPWSFSERTRIVVDAAQSDNARLQEVAKLSASELLARNLSATLAFGSEEACGLDDIYISLVPATSITQEANPYDAFSVTIRGEVPANTPGIVIQAATENAVIYAFNVLQNLYLLNNNQIPASAIVDWAELPERRLFIDCGRKYFSKDWFIQTIREMSYVKLNTLDIHFSENLGFRIECDTDAAIVSDEHLTKTEVREILAEAEHYGINVIPSFDSPGHVDAILKVHPEYGQVSVTGTHYGAGLDITNAEAVAYIKSLYKEYFNLFGAYSCVTDFSIGADEYMEFDREPFFSSYQPVLDAWAHEKLGPEYNWTDTLATYINTMASFCKENGLRPRVFNDGLYYGANKSFKQKVELDPDLVVDFWSSIPWNSDVASLQTLVNHGFKHFSNINSTYTYFVLRTDGEPSFDTSDNTNLWWNSWRPGLFAGTKNESVLPDDDSRILGTGICVWCDNPTLCSEDDVSSGIADSLRFMACRASNTAAPSQLSMDDFQNLIGRLGHAAGWEKGSALPDPGDFAPVTPDVPVPDSDDAPAGDEDSADNLLPATGDQLFNLRFLVAEKN